MKTQVRTPVVWRWLICALLWQTGGVHAAHPDTATLLSHIERYNQHQETPLPVPTAAQLEQLVSGEVLSLRDRRPVAASGGQSRDRIQVVGYRLVPKPRLLVWLAALDLGVQHSERLAEHLVSVDRHGGSVWYQYLNMPWPVRDRHWMIRNTKNTALTQATDGATWEHAWRLEAEGEARSRQLLEHGAVKGLGIDRLGKAIYLPVNRGGWAMMAVSPDSTLVAAHVISELGGWIPDSFVASFAGRQLGSILNGLVARADVVQEQYTGEYPVFTGDGRRITPEMARRVATGDD